MKIASTLAVLACCFTTGAAAAQSYPERPIRLIVPYAPGGSADIVARLFADGWSKQLSTPIVIENRAGAGGNIGVDAVAKSKPDGYTIGLQTVSLAINPALVPQMPYDTLRDLSPIGMVANSQHVLVANRDLPVSNLRELIEAAKREPGELNYGSAGVGSTFHMSAELFKAVADVEIDHIPYRGGGPALIDTIGGQVDMSFPVISAAVPHVVAGALKGLAVTGSERSPLLPDVPTAQEAGLPGYVFDTWFMVFAPAGTNPDIIQKLNTTLNATLESAPIQERMVKEGFDPTPGTSQAADQRLKEEMPKWAKLIEERGIKAD